MMKYKTYKSLDEAARETGMAPLSILRLMLSADFPSPHFNAQELADWITHRTEFCVECGGELPVGVTKGPDKIYCNDACRMRHWRKEQKRKKPKRRKRQLRASEHAD